MIIKSLAIEDFRVFGGRQDFDLAPKRKYGKNASIILFGGLNGAGKTSILTAILVALYGRQALGLGTSQKAYEEFLTESIHKSPQALIEKNAAKIELSFSFANMGVITNYRIVRSWERTGNKIKELLKIFDNDKVISDLSLEQAQAFLNELIPIGVSDLFFFDGEKIKSLAEDKTGKALADAIRKLLGIDLIHRLSADLTLVLRDKDKQTVEKDILDSIKEEEKLLQAAEEAANAELIEFENCKYAYIELENEIDRIENQLDADGGAWAKNRDILLKEHTSLLAEKQYLEGQLREELANGFPLSLMKNHLSKVKKVVVNEATVSKRSEALSVLDDMNDSLVEELAKSLKVDNIKITKSLKRWLQSQFSAPGQTVTHEVTESQRQKIYTAIDSANDVQKATTLTRKLNEVKENLDDKGVSLSRAPDERLLKSQFEELKSLTKKRNELHAKLLAHKEERRKQLFVAITAARKLSSMHNEMKQAEGKDRSVTLGLRAKDMINEFADLATMQKVEQLQQEFTHSYARLARKEDHRIRAKIDPVSFDVVLIDDADREINKNDLSAGEKQIYAIAVLEALARTSGRNLPIIIDTPLGRLDSKHREKLREHYFPHASHQVIILSTDTEIDEDFYSKLERDISHSYQLEFDPIQKATKAVSGYFWRKGKAA